MTNLQVFHVHWERHSWENVDYSRLNEPTHYGLYQVYGTHPVYGSDKLLYIGKAQEQRFGARLGQHWDFDVNYFPAFSHLHIGRIELLDDGNQTNWGDAIDKIEKLLILANCPAFNAANIKGTLNSEVVGRFLVINWGDYGEILSECSSLKYSERYWNSKGQEPKLLSE